MLFRGKLLPNRIVKYGAHSTHNSHISAWRYKYWHIMEMLSLSAPISFEGVRQQYYESTPKAAL